MATLSNDFDQKGRRFCKNASVNDSNVTFIKIRYVVISIHFVDAIQAAFFDHGLGAARAFLCWLEEKSYELVGGHLVSLRPECLGCGHQRCHVPIMAAHVGKVSLTRVFKFFVIF